VTLDKAIEHGKEKRKPYYRSARFDRTCRCHGSCGYCMRNRLHSRLKAELEAELKLEEFEEEENGTSSEADNDERCQQ
jgi:hypothetical protein